MYKEISYPGMALFTNHRYGQASPIGGVGVLPPTPPRAADPPPLAASEASRHFFRVFSSFFAFNHD